MEELIEKRRELGEDVIVTFLSLVGRPANRLPIIMKSDGSFEGYADIVKYDEPRGILYTMPYQPMREDSQGDFARAETIEKWAHSFLGAGRTANVDYEHNYRPGYGNVVESYILRGEDPMFPNAPKGTWCVAIQLTDAGKDVAKSVGGVSFAGSMMKRKSEEEVRLGCRPKPFTKLGARIPN